jgi:diguanylate cyclase (GGDEF)-like protein
MRLISLKKYLEMEITHRQVDLRAGDTLLPAVIELYFSALRAMGKGAVQACPAVGPELERALVEIETRLASKITPDSVTQAEIQVGERLEKWGTKTAEHFQSKTGEVKELLIMLANTAASVGERDQRYAAQFNDLTTSLKAIANLDDITQIRSSLVQRATELKTCVDQMSRDSQDAVATLRAEVSDYQTKLQAVEHLALKDTLTGVANRRSIEARMEWLIVQNEPFCVVMLDLNGFKEINDTHGHAAGDDLLVQFAKELESNVRATDLVGRWGGDEFVVVLASHLAGAKTHLERIQKWVFGKYTIQAGAGKSTQDVQISASFGMAEGRGKTMHAVIKEADAAMYKEKQAARKLKS